MAPSTINKARNTSPAAQADAAKGRVNAFHESFMSTYRIGLSADNLAAVAGTVDQLLAEGKTNEAEIVLTLAYRGVVLQRENPTRFAALMKQGLAGWKGSASDKMAYGTRLAEMIRLYGADAELDDREFVALAAWSAGYAQDRYVGATPETAAELLKSAAGGSVRDLKGAQTTGTLQDVLQSFTGHPGAKRRIGAQQASKVGVPADTLPDGQTYSHKAAARFVIDKMDTIDGMVTGMVSNDEQNAVLDVFRGMHVEDRKAVFAEIASQGEGAGSPVNWIADAMGDEQALRFRAMTRPNNTAGVLLPHDYIMLGMSGVQEAWQTIAYIIENSSHRQLNAYGAGIKRDYGKEIDVAGADDRGAVEIALKEGDSIFSSNEYYRRALFALYAPRDQGVITAEAWAGFEVEEAMFAEGVDTYLPWDRGTNETRLLTALAPLTQSAVAAAAGSWDVVNQRGWKHDAKATNGGLDPRDSAMAAAIRGEIDDAGTGLFSTSSMGEAQLETVNLLLQGVTYDPNGVRTPAEQRAVTASFIAHVIPWGTSEDLMLALSFIREDDDYSDENSWKPVIEDVRLAHEAMRLEVDEDGDRKYADLQPVFSAAVTAVATPELSARIKRLLRGDTLTGPEATAMAVRRQLSGSLSGFFGGRSRSVLAALDRPNDPNAKQFIAEMLAFDATLDKGDLKADLLDRYGATIDLPNGKPYPSKLARLLNGDHLTQVDRMIYALHEKDGAIGVFDKLESDTALSLVESLTGLEKVILADGYQQATGRSLWDAMGEIDDNSFTTVDWQRRNLRRAMHKVRVSPFEVNDTALQMAGLLAPDARADVQAAAVEKYLKPRGFTSRDHWLRATFGDADPSTAKVDSAQLEALQDQLRNTSGDSWKWRAANFAASRAISFEDFVKYSEEIEVDALGNEFRQALVGMSRPVIALMQERAGVVGHAAARTKRVEDEIAAMSAQNTPDINALAAKWEEYADAVTYTQRAHADALRAVAELDEAGDADIEMLSNALVVGAAVAGNALLPGAGVLLMGAITGSAKMAPYVLGGAGGLTSALQFAQGAPVGMLGKHSTQAMGELASDIPITAGAVHSGAHAGKTTYGVMLARLLSDPRALRSEEAIARTLSKAMDAVPAAMLTAVALYVTGRLLTDEKEEVENDDEVDETGNENDDNNVDDTDDVDGGDDVDDGTGNDGENVDDNTSRDPADQVDQGDQGPGGRPAPAQDTTNDGGANDAVVETDPPPAGQETGDRGAGGAATDTAGTDTNVADTNVTDTNVTDTNVTDTNVTDTNVTDTNVTDTNVTDTNVTDTTGASTGGTPPPQPGVGDRATGSSTVTDANANPLPSQTAATDSSNVINEPHDLASNLRGGAGPIQNQTPVTATDSGSINVDAAAGNPNLTRGTTQSVDTSVDTTNTPAMTVEQPATGNTGGVSSHTRGVNTLDNPAPLPPTGADNTTLNAATSNDTLATVGDRPQPIQSVGNTSGSSTTIPEVAVETAPTPVVDAAPDLRTPTNLNLGEEPAVTPAVDTTTHIRGANLPSAANNPLPEAVEAVNVDVTPSQVDSAQNVRGPSNMIGQPVDRGTVQLQSSSSRTSGNASTVTLDSSQRVEVNELRLPGSTSNAIAAEQVQNVNPVPTETIETADAGVVSDRTGDTAASSVDTASTSTSQSLNPSTQNRTPITGDLDFTDPNAVDTTATVGNGGTGVADAVVLENVNESVRDGVVTNTGNGVSLADQGGRVTAATTDINTETLGNIGNAEVGSVAVQATDTPVVDTVIDGGSSGGIVENAFNFAENIRDYVRKGSPGSIVWPTTRDDEEEEK